MNILIFISHETLFGPQGAQKRLQSLIDLLEGENIYYLLPDTVPEHLLAALKGKGRYTFSEPSIAGRRVPYPLDFCRQWRCSLKEIVSQESIELIVCNFPWGASSLAAERLAPMVYFSHGVERDFVEITARHLHLDFFPFTCILRTFVSYIESRAVRDASLVVTMSENDGQRYAELYGVDKNKCYYLPQAVRVNPKSQNKAALKERLGLPIAKTLLLFHGSHGHLPNREAIDVLRRSIAPGVLEVHKDVEFIIAGPGIPVFNEDGFRSLGYVEDLSLLVRACDAAIVPIFSGAGVRMKLFDYFAEGLPVLSTKKGAQGLSLTHGKELWLCENDAHAFTAKLCEFLGQKQTWDLLADEARTYVHKEHDPATLHGELRARFSQLLRAEC